MPRRPPRPSPSLPQPRRTPQLPPAPGAFVDLAAEWLASGLPVRQLLRRRTSRLRALPSRSRRLVENRLYDLARQREPLTTLIDQVVDTAPVEAPRPDRRQRLLLIWLALGAGTGDDPALPEAVLDPRWVAALQQLHGEPTKPAFPDEVVAELQARLGAAEADEAMAALEARAPLVLRVRPPATRERVLDELAASEVPVAPHPQIESALVVRPPQRLERHPALRQGRACVQDAASQLAVQALGIEPGQVVLDACAGGGGKALAIWDTLRGEGELCLVDQDARRLRHALERLPEATAPTLTHHIQDGRAGPPPELLGRADRVLVDAPCSGLGTVRRQPELKWRYDAAALQQFATLQRELALAAVPALRPGGRLLYTTCSLRQLENEQTAATLAADPRLRPLPLEEVLGPLASELGAEGHMLTLWPHRHDTDGFYFALFERVE